MSACPARPSPRCASTRPCATRCFAGGERLALPVYCIAAAEALRRRRGKRPWTPPPAAVECMPLPTPSSTTTISPAMDDDDLRRGRPASRRRLGEGHRRCWSATPCQALALPPVIAGTTGRPARRAPAWRRCRRPRPLAAGTRRLVRQDQAAGSRRRREARARAARRGAVAMRPSEQDRQQLRSAPASAPSSGLTPRPGAGGPRHGWTAAGKCIGLAFQVRGRHPRRGRRRSGTRQG
ncbi:MAG: hypothetical protein U5L11_05285 [Arhodomonas sp.]|nr:hypothetical protein [Arhodomonas sp.]